MKNKNIVVLGITFITVFFALSSMIFAQDIKARFKDRLPKIIELKSKGVIGENNQGYLEFVGTAKQMQDVVDAENRDRRSVYEDIARQQGASVQTVGQRRALQLRELANPGDWIQDDTGKWYRK